MPFEGGYAEKPKKSVDDISAWALNIIEGSPDREGKEMKVEDNTYWEEGRVSPEVMSLIEKTEAIQKAFKELRDKRGDMGEKDVRHMIRVAELIRTAADMNIIELSAEDRRDLLVAALCHDEGKADESVRKVLKENRGKNLSPEDRKIMQKHVVAGAYFLELCGERRAARIIDLLLFRQQC